MTMLIRENNDIGHAARAAEGRTIWIQEWKTAWGAADRAASTAESRAAGRATSRAQWAKTLAAARNLPPPMPSDAEWNERWIPAWNLAWDAAWNAAIQASNVSLSERGKGDSSPVKRWDKSARAARETAGCSAGCAAWNDTYREEVKKITWRIQLASAPPGAGQDAARNT